MDTIILEKLEKANVVVDEKKQTIEVFLDVGEDGEPLEIKTNGIKEKVPNPNFRKWRQDHVKRHLKNNGYKYGECIEGLKSVITNTAGNSNGYWKYKLLAEKSVKNIEIKKQDIKNENTENTKTKKPRSRKTKE
tara:strand:+ start:185 stop:586 length:402 start_codon:yes stop_codon:yes gene_type:complete